MAVDRFRCPEVVLRKVVFDSSFLIAVVETPTTWYEDIIGKAGRFEPIILDCVKRELTGLARGETKRGRFARLAGELAKGFRVEKCGGLSVDDEIASFSKGAGAFVATVDGRLLARLRRLHVQTITLRSGRVELS